MDSNRCTCGLLPCICVSEAEEFVELNNLFCDEDRRKDTMLTKNKLRLLLAADATFQCMSCKMLPCICPAEDEDTPQSINDSVSMDATKLSASDGGSDTAKEIIDQYGRVQLSSIANNIHEKPEDDVWIAKEIKPMLKPHQVDGVKFLYSHVAAGHGCILADYMGLGKTLQVITVIYSFIVDEIEARQRHDQTCDDSKTIPKEEEEHNKNSNVENAMPTVLVLCPAICLPNWTSEFEKWLTAESRVRCPILTLDTYTTKSSAAGRLRLLQRWKRTGGVLLMGYEMFRGMLNPTTTPISCFKERDASIHVCLRMTSAKKEITSTLAQKAADIQRTAREYRQLLCNPGANLVVMDEGHRMKDPSSLLCQSVAQIQTSRRIVLTGYPVQNSLSEYWCMVNFARDGFLGSYEEFRAKYERPVLEGNLIRSRELIKRLQSIVLRRGKGLLRSQLPPKKEWILYCKLSPVQRRLYCDFLDFYGDDTSAAADLLTAYAALLQVMNHPDIIYSKLCPSQQETTLLLEDEEFNDAVPTMYNISGWAWESKERLLRKRQIAVALERRKRLKITGTQNSYEWARSVIFGQSKKTSLPSVQPLKEGYQTQLLENSGKMAVLMRIVKESFACGDKVVVFSQSVPTLKVISNFLQASDFSPSHSGFSPSRASNVATDKRRRFEKPSIFRGRKIASRPNRDPAGIMRKRRMQAEASVSSARETACVDGPLNEWFLQIDGSTNGVKRMENIQVIIPSSTSYSVYQKFFVIN